MGGSRFSSHVFGLGSQFECWCMLMSTSSERFWKRFQARLAGNSHKKGRFSDSKSIKKFSQCLLAVRSYYDRLRSRSSAAYVRSDRWRNWPTTRIKRINILGTWKIHAKFLCLKQHETTETTSLCSPFFCQTKTSFAQFEHLSKNYGRKETSFGRVNT